MRKGTWGNITVAPNPNAKGAAVVPNAFYAQARMHDPRVGKVVQVRKFGPTEAAAKKRLEDELHERAAYVPLSAPDHLSTFGEVLTWWWAEARPRQGWTETTDTSMGYARKRLEELSGWHLPVDIEKAHDQLGDSRTAKLAIRLLWQVERDWESTQPV